MIFTKRLAPNMLSSPVFPTAIIHHSETRLPDFSINLFGDFCGAFCFIVFFLAIILT